MNQFNLENGVAAIRVSSVRQGTEGDSPEAQKEQLEQFARSHNIKLVKTFVFLESASKLNQPMQEAIDFCKNPKNDVQLFIIKSIDRFTRGGATPYDLLKNQLEKYGVKLVDIYGIISSTKVNTLEHLGVKYGWSEYSPTQKIEFLEAERAKDELRDIMSRMIGAEIRYTRMGYWMRRQPYGYTNKKIETGNGKRYILVPDPNEAKFIEKMFELRSRKTLTDQEIVDQINQLGYKSRSFNSRINSPTNSTLSTSAGNNQLTLKRLWIYLRNPIYAGVICEKWTDYKPIKARFDGLVSFELFNQANKGKVTLKQVDCNISIYYQAVPEFQLKKGSHNLDYPYRKVITCPECEQPLFGSAPKGRHKYYPGYHCNKRGHYFRVPKEKLESTVEDFVHQITYTQNHIDDLMDAVKIVWDKRQAELYSNQLVLQDKIKALKSEATAVVSKIKFLSSQTAINYMEEELIRIEEEIKNTSDHLAKTDINQPISFEVVLQYTRYFLEHIDYLLLQQSNPIQKANYFSLIFDKTPTYREIDSGTKNIGLLTGINELFSFKNMSKSLMVRERGLEPPYLSAHAPKACVSTIPPLALMINDTSK